MSPVDLLNPLVPVMPKYSIDSVLSIDSMGDPLMAIRVSTLFVIIGVISAGPFVARAQEDKPSPPADGEAAAPASAEEADPFEDDVPATASISDFHSSCGKSVAGDSSCNASCGGCGECCGPFQRWLGGVGALGVGGNGFNVRGWVSQGLTYNAEDPPNNANFPVTFNDRANEYQMNQAYLIMESPVTTCGCSWDFGGRVDLLYGTDYYYAEAAGLETNTDGTPRWNGGGPRSVAPGSAALYGLAMPQAYAEVYAPVAGGVNLKLGHFYSPIGYEQVMAPENFFYSHSYALQYGEPKTFTGAIAEYQWNSNLSLLLGGTAGWNSYDSARRQWGILSGMEWTSSDRCTSLAWTFHTGEDGLPGLNSPGFFQGPVNPDNVSVQSLVLTRCITDRLQYVLQHDFGVEQRGSVAGAALKSAKWYGVNQYLLYDVCDDWSLGCRFEWFRDQDHSRVVALRTTDASGGNYFALTMGGNWRPCPNVRFRPEIRYDWSDTEYPPLNVGGPFDFLGKDRQLTAAFDLVVEF